MFDDVPVDKSAPIVIVPVGFTDIDPATYVAPTLTDATLKLYPSVPFAFNGLTPTGNAVVDVAFPPPVPVVHIIGGRNR